MVSVLGSVKLFLLAIIWKISRSSKALRGLIDALGSTDQDQQAIAGMLLVRAGRSVEPQLHEALARGENVDAVQTVLDSIRDR